MAVPIININPQLLVQTPMLAVHFAEGMMIGLLMAGLCVSVHYEGIRALENVSSLPLRWFKRPRQRIGIIMMGVVVLHLFEIGLFATLYAMLDHLKVPGDIIETLPQAGSRSQLDYMYYSSEIYTSLGLGDFVPTKIFRVVSSVEALVGLLMIAWSASFTYVLMQRFWKPK